MVRARSILIVGGGLAGLCLAAALRQRGFGIEIVEREREWNLTGAGIAVQPNALRVLRELGLADAVLASGEQLVSWTLCERDGKPLCELDLGRFWGDTAPFVGTTRRALHHALAAGARGVPCRMGVRVRALETLSNGVRASFSDGSAQSYDLVVGADGLYSSLRRWVLARAARDARDGDHRALEPALASPRELGQMVWRSLAPITLPGLRGVRFLLGEGCFFGLVPVGAGVTYGFGNLRCAPHRDPVPGRRARLRQRFAGFGGGVPEYLAALTSDEQVHCSSLAAWPESVWRAGRVALVGDAAHGCSPMLGQGGAMAIEDAWLLAEALSTGTELDAALTAFVERREPRVAWVREQSLSAGAALDLEPAVRNALLRERGEGVLAARFEPLRAPP